MTEKMACARSSQRRTFRQYSEIGLGDGALQVLASQTGTPVCELSTDSIATADGSYIELMTANAAEIVSCLGD